MTFIPINPRFPNALGWVRRLPVVRTLLNQMIYLPSLARLWDADVVHVFSASYWSFLLAPVPAMIVGRCLNKHVVLNYHSGEADDHLSHWGSLVHPWLGLAHDLVVPSPVSPDGLRAARLLGARGSQRRRRVALSVSGACAASPRVLSTRNLEPYYRVDLVDPSVRAIQREVPDATLTIAGYGSEERRLRALARRAWMRRRAISSGESIPTTCRALYADHDIFVNASVLDNQPVSILEAFASGLPVVSTAAGDIPTWSGTAKREPVPPADAGRSGWRDGSRLERSRRCACNGPPGTRGADALHVADGSRRMARHLLRGDATR